ncbi:MAG: hypothetical protein IJ185_05695 [Prevotella sp.]|nr:hypothetical protein [Prevotella sp.]
MSAALEFGFRLTYRQVDELKLLYFWVWITFLIDRGSHLLLMRKGYLKSEYSFIGWCINALLMLTLIPVIVNFAGIDDSHGIMNILDNRVFHVTVLFLISIIDLSDGVIRLLGRKMNPALMMAFSFMVFILVGSGLLMMPRCVLPGVHLPWIDSLFTATSAVCVTGLTTVDVPATFTYLGQFIIMILIPEERAARSLVREMELGAKQCYRRYRTFGGQRRDCMLRQRVGLQKTMQITIRP